MIQQDEQVFEYLYDKIDERIKPIEEALSRGQCADFNEYKFLVGQVRGLRMARDVLNELYEKIIKEEAA